MTTNPTAFAHAAVPTDARSCSASTTSMALSRLPMAKLRISPARATAQTWRTTNPGRLHS